MGGLAGWPVTMRDLLFSREAPHAFKGQPPRPRLHIPSSYWRPPGPYDKTGEIPQSVEVAFSGRQGRAGQGSLIETHRHSDDDSSLTNQIGCRRCILPSSRQANPPTLSLCPMLCCRAVMHVDSYPCMLLSINSSYHLHLRQKQPPLPPPPLTDQFFFGCDEIPNIRCRSFP